MASTTFSGPVTSVNGFIGAVTGNVSGVVTLPISTTAALPAAAASNAGQMRIVSDNGAGNNEYCVVISTGTAWVTAVGAALS